MLKTTTIALLGTMMMVSFAGPAAAELNICNKSTRRTVSVAVAYKDGSRWVSRGWWTLQQGECKTPIGGNLSNRYYYYYAHGDGGSWAGDHRFCTISAKFELYNPKSCDNGNFKGFAELDVEGKTSWTNNLVD